MSWVIQVIIALLKKRTLRQKISAAACKHKEKTLVGIKLRDGFYKASESFYIPPLKWKMLSLISYCRMELVSLSEGSYGIQRCLSLDVHYCLPKG